MKTENDEVVKNFTTITIGDKLLNFFTKNAKICVLMVLLMVMGLLGWGLAKLALHHKTYQMQAAYSKLESKDSKLEFIKKYNRFQLAGLVSLSLGDDHFQSKNYTDAISEYSRSAKLLKKTFLFPRALTSQAVAMYKSGDFNQSEIILNSVIYDKTFDKTFRSNAAFLLVSMLKNDGNLEKAKTLAKELSNLDLSTGFIQAIKGSAIENKI